MTLMTMDESTFRRESERALEALKRALIRAEENGGFEAEENSGVLNIVLEDKPGKFVITPNTPIRQIWISAQSTSFKLDWDAGRQAFVLPRTSEDLIGLIERLLRESLEDPAIQLRS